MILETEFYFAVGKQHKHSAYKKSASDPKFIKVRILSLIKKITISEIMIRQWPKEKAIEIIVNPKISELTSEGRTVNIRPVMPGSSSAGKEEDGGKLGTSPDIPVKIPKEDDDQDNKFSTEDILNSIFNINGYGRTGNVNLPGGEVSEDVEEKEPGGFAKTLVEILTKISGAFKGLEGREKFKQDLGPAGAFLGSGGEVYTIVVFVMAGAIYTEKSEKEKNELGNKIQKAINKFTEGAKKAWEAAKTPKTDDITDGRTTTVVLGMKPTEIPGNPAIDDILEGQDEPLLVFRQRNQAVDPKADENLPEFGGDMIVVFNTSQGVTDPQYDKTKVIGNFFY